MKRAMVGAAGVAVLGLALAACGGGSSASSGHSKKSTSTTTTAAPTTTVPTASDAALKPLLLTVDQFPKGWKQDENAVVGTQGTPSCISDVALIKGSTAHLSAAFLAKAKSPLAIQTVGAFAPGKAQPSAATLQADFSSCSGASLTQGTSKATISVLTLKGLDTGDAGFAAQMTFSSSGQDAYLDVYYAVKGDYATVLGWEDTSRATGEFATMAGKALAKVQ